MTTTAGRGGVEPFPLGAVTLTAGPFARAKELALQSALQLDPDRLLAPFRRESGLPTGPGYGGWEADGLDGHTLGHALSALAAHAASGSAAARARMEQILGALRECQLALGTGYIGGVPDGVALWDEIADGRVEAQTFDLDGRWAPLYNLHKTLTGLVDAVVYAGSGSARVIAEEHVRWWVRTFAALTDARVEQVLRTEPGGLTATFARWAEATGDTAAWELAQRLAVRSFLEPLAAGSDPLDGRHANAHIPLAVGYAVLARMGAPAEYGRAADTFWESVVGHRTTSIGGNSVSEHFPPRDDWSSMFTAREGPETCNTVNMVELAREMYRRSGDPAHLAYIERALSAHLLSAQHPEHGGIVYFTSHRPGHHRVSSRPEAGFWCCMGTGLEAPSRYALSVFGRAPGRIDVQVLIAARLEDDGIVVEVGTSRPFGDDAIITVTTTAPRRLALRVRVPDGVVPGCAVARVGGDTVHPSSEGWLELDREWQGRSTVEVELPPVLRWERPPGVEGWGWIVDGPRVLAERLPEPAVDPRGTDARMGHIARGALLPLADTPILAPDDLIRAERRDGGIVVLPPTSAHDEVVLEPFAALHDDRYVLSFPVASEADAGRRRAELVAEDARADALDARTLDVIAFGQQQPESDHGLALVDSESGYDEGAHWRRFRAEGAFTLQDWSATAVSLRIAWLADDVPRRIAVTLDGHLLLDRTIDPLDEPVLDFDLSAHADGRVLWALAIGGAEGTPRLTEVRMMSARLG
ncbi:beta-L-arabinofuranosidase domain-containing protein [Microbacterium oleivorans]|uniref:beta-L-arabinofuranosidase domain-containing protein n=1 Tax=Microbacterium oleivorans TaxID=273677 RepID=UPI002041437E|nr:beta-L-arabinofuranosidase domain-containing protein [Microbacterium oleivorans]MCM3696741.1 glycoside hydrolase family 127 protein [Microbacterium oleivorans]